MSLTTPHPAAPVVKSFQLDRLKLDEPDTTADIAKFEGIASAVGVLDRHNEVIEAGAFDATLAKDGPTFVMLYQHDPAKPIGVIHLSVDPRGNLMAEGEINLATELGRETHALMKQGALKSMSIGFNIPEGGAVWDQKAGVLRILAVELWEVSVVTFPANPAATVDSVKHAFGIGQAPRILSAEHVATLEAAITALKAAIDASPAPTTVPEPNESQNGKAPTNDAAELAGVKELVAQISREISEGESAA